MHLLPCNRSTKQMRRVQADAEMSSSYSANQYNSAFKSQRLQNWCETKHFKEKPTAHHGHATFIANDRGHLFPGAVKRGSAWPDFKGTWDLPARIPPCHINPTSRSVEGLNRLKSWGFDPQYTGKSPPHTGSKNTDRRQDVAKQSDGVVQQEGAAPFSAGEAQPLPQSCAATTGERAASQNQDSQAAVAGSVAQQDPQATGKDRPVSQCFEAEDKPALRPATEEGNTTDTGVGRPVSNVSEECKKKNLQK